MKAVPQWLLIGLVAAALGYAAKVRVPAGRVKPASKTNQAAKKTTSPAAPASGERALAARWLQGMSLHDRIAQTVIVPCFGDDPSSRSRQFRDYAHLVRDVHVGGFVVINRVVAGSVRNAQPHAMASFLNRMQRLSKVPLIVAADFERGASMRVAGTARYPHLMAYGAAQDPELTRQLGAATAREARALGIQWIFAPDADVNNNPDNPIINTRSFGENPKSVSEHVRAFIAGAHANPAHRVIVTAKHFPGHGDTSVDSHMNLPVLNADRERIESTELEPFRAAVAGGVDAIMSAHMSVPALDPEGMPATVSPKLLTGVLRDQLRFNGIIVTDAMDMQGLAKQFAPGEAAVRAIEAGADVLLMPQDPERAIAGVLAAVKQGRITEKRITESAARILAAKARTGLARNRLVDVEAISDTVESPDLAEQAQIAADKAVTLVKNEAGIVPLRNPLSACVWVLAESRYGQGGRRFTDELRQRVKDERVMLLDPQVSEIEITDALSKAGKCETQVVTALVTTGAYRGNATLGGAYSTLMGTLQKGPAPVVLIALGSPYLLRMFPGVSSYMATFSAVPTAEVAAVKALLGEITISGRLPVSIPGLAKAGDGISTDIISARQ